MTLSVGIVICLVIGFVTSFGGYKAVIIFETYTWIPFFILTLVVYGQTGKLADINLPPAVTGMSYTGAVLTYFAASYGCTSVYVSWVADYCVHYPADISRSKLFASAVAGMWSVTFLGMFTGAPTGSALFTNQDLVTVYTEKGVGALLLAVTYPTGFSKFILVIFSFGGGKWSCDLGLLAVFFLSHFSINHHYSWLRNLRNILGILGRPTVGKSTRSYSSVHLEHHLGRSHSTSIFSR